MLQAMQLWALIFFFLLFFNLFLASRIVEKLNLCVQQKAVNHFPAKKLQTCLSFIFSWNF
jgi:hypothetical protein